MALGCGSTNNSAVKNDSTAKVDAQNSAFTAAKVQNQQVAAAATDTAAAVVPDDQKVIEDALKKYDPKNYKQSGSEKGNAPGFELQDIFYDTYNMDTYKGKQPVLLVFFATWCRYCGNELRTLHGRYPKLVQDGLEVLAIDVGESIEKVIAFSRSINPGFKMLVDTDTIVSNSYRVVGVPTYILVDQSGAIVFQDNTFPEDYKGLLKIQ
jgi:peroxiredoxin